MTHKGLTVISGFIRYSRSIGTIEPFVKRKTQNNEEMSPREIAE